LDSYRLMVDASRDRLAFVIAEIAMAPPAAIVVHCHAGRDRTGLVVALALHIAGVSVESIAADYALTDDASHAVMAETFAHLNARYGGAANYLVGCVWLQLAWPQSAPDSRWLEDGTEASSCSPWPLLSGQQRRPKPME
jgi:Tyrosine phosphatase family